MFIFIISGWAQYNFSLTCLSDTLQEVPANGVGKFRFRLANNGSLNDVYEINCHVIESVPDWFVSLCVRGRCVMPGISVFDTLNAGQTDTTITITVYTTSNTGRKVVSLNVCSLGDSTKRASIRVYIQSGQGIEYDLSSLNEFSSGFRIYPNPTRSKATVYLRNLKTDQSRFISVAIYDVNGTLVKSYTYTCNAGILWDGQNEQGKLVSAGNYFVAITQNGRVIVSKPIKFVK